MDATLPRGVREQVLDRRSEDKRAATCDHAMGVKWALSKCVKSQNTVALLEYLPCILELFLHYAAGET